MAAGDEVMEGSISSFFLDSVESKQSGDVFSLEDLAWADSCLVKDSEISDNNWDSLKDALLKILTSQELSEAGRDGFTEGTDSEILPSGEEAMGMTVDYDVSCNDEEEQNSDDDMDEKIDSVKSRTKFQYPFLPNYSEYLNETENTDPGLESGFAQSVSEPSIDDIFKVWDLDSAAEEDELIKQLNKALAENSPQSMPSTFDDSGGQKDPKEESLDDLIAGISDLSLNQKSG